MEENSNWKKTVMILGGFGGLLVGLAAAWLFIRSHDEDSNPRLTSGEGMKIGLGVVNFLRQIASGGPH
jgi:hypothetical protein